MHICQEKVEQSWTEGAYLQRFPLRCRLSVYITKGLPRKSSGRFPFITWLLAYSQRAYWKSNRTEFLTSVTDAVQSLGLRLTPNWTTIGVAIFEENQSTTNLHRGFRRTKSNIHHSKGWRAYHGGVRRNNRVCLLYGSGPVFRLTADTIPAIYPTYCLEKRLINHQSSQEVSVQSEYFSYTTQ